MRPSVSGRCRTCLSRRGGRPLFDEGAGASATPSPAAMLAQLVDAPIAADDALPKTVCDECLRRIVDAYDFRRECLKVQRTLSALLDGASDDELARGVLGDEPSPQRRRKPEPKATKRARILPKVDAPPNGEPRTRVCSVCDVAFDSSASLTVHNLKVHFPSRPDGKFACDACGKVYKHKYVLSRHERKAHLAAPESKIRCEKCGFVCTTLSALRVHQKSNCDDSPVHETDEGRVACKLCNESFSGIKNLALHVRYHSSNVCQYCNRGFVHERALLAHLTEHANESGAYVCALCGNAFSLKKTLLRHQRSRHGTVRERFFCGHCTGSNFVTIETLQTHLSCSHNEIVSRDDTARSANRTELNVRSPVRAERAAAPTGAERRTSEATQKFETEPCTEFNEKSKYIITYLVDETANLFDTAFKELTECIYNGGSKTVKTDDCAASVIKMMTQSLEKCADDSSVTVTNHDIIKDIPIINLDSINVMTRNESIASNPAVIEKEHDKIIIFSDMNVADIENNIQNFEQNEIITIKKRTCDRDKQCSPCTSFSEKRNDNIEDKNERGNECDSMVQCTVCSKKFIRLFNLQKHMISHKTEIPYCIGCCFVAKNHDELKDHLRQCRLLRKSGNLICVYCDKKLTTTAGLRYHLQTHSSMRQHSCPSCQKCFLTRNNLKTHFQTMHSQTRSYMCSSCPRAFANSNHLHKHIVAAHTGQRNYVCTTCGRRFMQSSHLTQHMWTHTGIKPHCCPHCPNKYTAKCSLRKHLRRNHWGEKSQEQTLSMQQDKSIKQSDYCSSVLNTHLEICSDNKTYRIDETDDESDRVNVVVVLETTENIVDEYEKRLRFDHTEENK